MQQATGLRPTHEKLLNGLKSLKVPPHLRDHMRNMLLGRIICGSYWNNIHGYESRAFCSICKKRKSIEVIESEQHIWLECENNGQSAAWEIARTIWEKTTPRPWPNISLGLIRGAAALSFENDYSKDSERLRILISMTIWTIGGRRETSQRALRVLWAEDRFVRFDLKKGPITEF